MKAAEQGRHPLVPRMPQRMVYGEGILSACDGLRISGSIGSLAVHYKMYGEKVKDIFPSCGGERGALTDVSTCLTCMQLSTSHRNSRTWKVHV